MEEIGRVTFKSLGFMNGSNVPGSSCLGVLAFDYPTLRKQVSRQGSKEVLPREVEQPYSPVV